MVGNVPDSHKFPLCIHKNNEQLMLCEVVLCIQLTTCQLCQSVLTVRMTLLRGAFQKNFIHVIHNVISSVVTHDFSAIATSCNIAVCI